jgi:hypothetical protein
LREKKRRERERTCEQQRDSGEIETEEEMTRGNTDIHTYLNEEELIHMQWIALLARTIAGDAASEGKKRYSGPQEVKGPWTRRRYSGTDQAGESLLVPTINLSGSSGDNWIGDSERQRAEKREKK